MICTHTIETVKNYEGLILDLSDYFGITPNGSDGRQTILFLGGLLRHTDDFVQFIYNLNGFSDSL